MNLLDVDIWLALALSGHSRHLAAWTWLDGESQTDSLCFCRVAQQGLLRRLTTAEMLPAYGNPPLSNREAWAVHGRLTEDERITFLDEPQGVEETWRSMACRDTNSPKLWMNAYPA